MHRSRPAPSSSGMQGHRRGPTAAAGRPAGRPGPTDGTSTRTPSGPIRWTSSSTTEDGVQRRGQPDHRRPRPCRPPPRTPSTSSTEPPPGDGGPAVGRAACLGSRGRPTRPRAPRRRGEAVPRNDDTGPGPPPRRPLGQGHQPGGRAVAARGGQRPERDPGVGRRGPRPPRPPTRRPWSAIRTRLPTRSPSSRAAGTA